MSPAVQQIAADAESACIATALGDLDVALDQLASIDKDALTEALLRDPHGRNMARWMTGLAQTLAYAAQSKIDRRAA